MGNTLYVFGGFESGESNGNVYTLDLDSCQWSIDKAGEEKPEARDDHAFTVADDNLKLFVWGGYVKGSRSNDFWAFDVEGKKWELLDAGSTTSPPPRVGASLIHKQGKLYLFGGQDDELDKTNEVWSYDLATSAWSLL